jgi:hypothetical protein
MSKEINTSDIDESGLQNADPIPVKSKPWWKLGGKDFSFVSVNSGYTESTNFNSSSEIKLEQPGTENLGRHVYETEDTKEIYKPIEGYEGAHRFDPNFTWDPEEEKRLVRTVRNLSTLFKYWSNEYESSIGALLYQHASCSSHFSSTAVTSPKQYPTLC